MIERVARDPAGDADKLERMFRYYEESLRRDAKAEFAADYVRMKPQLPRVVRTKPNTQTHSRYAPLEDINAAVDPILHEHGFGTATKVTAQTDHAVTVKAELWHRSGHVEDTSVTMPLDSSGLQGKVNKTLPHAVSSSITYGKRVAICALLNISVGDDLDGNSNGSSSSRETLSPEQIATIMEKIPLAKVGPRFLRYVDAPTVEEAGSLQAAVAAISVRQYRKAIAALDDLISKTPDT